MQPLRLSCICSQSFTIIQNQTYLRVDNLKKLKWLSNSQDITKIPLNAIVDKSSTGMSRLGKTSISLSLQRAGKALGMEPLAVQRAQEEHSTASNLLLETRSSMGKLPKLMMKMCVLQT